MKKVFSVLGIILFFYACQNTEPSVKTSGVKTDSVPVNAPYSTDCKSLFAEARKMDSIILQSIEANVNEGNKAIKAFTDFAYYCKEDTLAPVFLIKSAQIAKSINNLPQAKLCLEKCIEGHQNFKNRGAAMFLLAQMYDEERQLNDEEKAKEIYINIMHSYPKTAWARDAKAAMEMLGKTDEEIIKEFTEKKK